MAKKEKIKTKIIIKKPKHTVDVLRDCFRSYDEDSGIFYLGQGNYSICLRYSDIVFSKAPTESQINILEQWVKFLNSLNIGVQAQVICDNKLESLEYYDQAMLYKNDKLEKLSENFNELLGKSFSKANNKLIRRARFIVLSLNTKNLKLAKEKFNELESKCADAFKIIKSSIYRLKASERLELLYNSLNDSKYFKFNPENKSIQEFVKELKNVGQSIHYYLAPLLLDIKANKIQTSHNYMKCLYVSGLPNSKTPKFYNTLTGKDVPMSITTNIHPVSKINAIKNINRMITKMETTRLQRDKKLSKQRIDPKDYPDKKLEEKLGNALTLLEDVSKRDQNIFMTNTLIVIRAETEELLEEYTESIISSAGSYLVTISEMLHFQYECLLSVLPLGHNIVPVRRTLTSEATAIDVPFSSKDRFDEKSISYGLNHISNMPLTIDRKQLDNGNGIFTGISGGGKSFEAKMEIEQIALRYKLDNIIVLDPMAEYVKAILSIGGENIKIGTSSGVFINPFDFDRDYGRDDNNTNPLDQKIEFIITFIGSMLRRPLTASEKSIVDRCAILVYQDYIKSNYDEKFIPTLVEFRNTLLDQDEQEAKDLVLSMERYTVGSLDLFSKKTNVNFSNQYINFDLSNIQDSFRETAMLVVLDHTMNRLSENKRLNIDTHFYGDEGHIFLKNQYVANYLDLFWRVARKLGGFFNLITQMIEDLLNSEVGRVLLFNSDFILLKKQKEMNIADICEVLKISENEAEYLKEDIAWQGVIKAGNDNFVFTNRVAEESYLYYLNNTDSRERGNYVFKNN